MQGSGSPVRAAFFTAAFSSDAEDVVKEDPLAAGKPGHRWRGVRRGDFKSNSERGEETTKWLWEEVGMLEKGRASPGSCPLIRVDRKCRPCSGFRV